MKMNITEELMVFLLPREPGSLDAIYWQLAKNITSSVCDSFSRTTALKKLLESREAFWRAMEVHNAPDLGCTRYIYNEIDSKLKDDNYGKETIRDSQEIDSENQGSQPEVPKTESPKAEG